jgi:predicted protein tyrosine phosphatase
VLNTRFSYVILEIMDDLHRIRNLEEFGVILAIHRIICSEIPLNSPCLGRCLTRLFENIDLQQSSAGDLKFVCEGSVETFDMISSVNV